MAEAGSLSNLYIDDDAGGDAYGGSGAGTVEPPVMTLEERLALRDDEVRALRAALEDTTGELRQLRGVTLRRRIAFSGVSPSGEGDGHATAAGTSTSSSLFGAGGSLSLGGYSTPHPYTTCPTTLTPIYTPTGAYYAPTVLANNMQGLTSSATYPQPVVGAATPGPALGRGRSMTPIRAPPPFPGATCGAPSVPGWTGVGPTTGYLGGYHYGGAIPAVAPMFASSSGPAWNGVMNPFFSNPYVTNGYLTAPVAPAMSHCSGPFMPIPSVTAAPSIYGTALAPPVDDSVRVSTADDENHRRRTPGLKIPTYTYNGDIQLFLERMEIYFRAAGTRDTQKAELVLGSLDDLSLNAVMKQKQVGLNTESYDALKAFLEKRFVSPESGCTARLNFRVITQQANEKPEDYYTKLLGIAKEAYPKMGTETVNELLLHKFCDGIADPTIRLKLLEHDPKNTDDAVSYCSKLIKLRHYSAALENNNTNTTKSTLDSAQLAGIF
jgi:hypothetical protein